MYKPWHYLSVLVGVILVVAAPAWADYQAGVEAFTRGDYNTALRVFHPLAEGGHAEAQAMLGNIYTPGLGVPHDNHQAAKWYRLAAEQGLARAQLNLGLMYSKGQGVSKDNVLAHMWLTLAGAQGNAYARRAQNAVEKLMGNRNYKRPFCLGRKVPKTLLTDQSPDFAVRQNRVKSLVESFTWPSGTSCPWLIPADGNILGPSVVLSQIAKL